ncbi:hypothetical protein Hanom_Chr00s000003g01601241 [Helianthus anomalus]
MSWMKMARVQTFWIQMRKNKPLDESRISRQTSGTKKDILLKDYNPSFLKHKTVGLPLLLETGEGVRGSGSSSLIKLSSYSSSSLQ